MCWVEGCSLTTRLNSPWPAQNGVCETIVLTARTYDIDEEIVIPRSLTITVSQLHVER
jgi:hypothetical protein